MVNFSKILGLAGAAVVFSGLAYGQATCAAPTAVSLGIIRAEGTTEQVSQLQFVCTSATAVGVPGTASLQLFMSPALPITSKVLSTSTGATEAIVTVNGGAQVQGTVSGSTLSFSNVALPTLAAGGTYTFLVSNVRVNATSLTVGTGVPPTVSEIGFVSGSATNIVPAALASTTVAFAQNGLGTTKSYQTFTVGAAWPAGGGSSSGTNSFVVCNGYSPKGDGVNYTTPGVANPSGGSLAFVVQVNENFSTAFKTAAGESSQVAVPALPAAQQNTVVDGTRIQVNFSNVPANVTLYVPNGAIPSAAAGSPGTIQLTTSAPGTAGASGVVTGSTSSSITKAGFASGSNNSLAAVTVSSGSGSAVFEVTAQDNTFLDSYNIPVFIVTSSNSVAPSTTAITTSVSFNPIGSTVIPNFAVTSSTTTLTESTFSSCSTSLLFPFVTNQLGFDTGLAIANTSSDPFAANQGGATAQAGTCTLNFYGSGAPSPSNVTTANVPSGTVYVQALSGIAAGFQGYMIAYCQFQFAHGFAFITDGVGASGGLSQGYLAGVIPDVNQIARGANPIGSINTKGFGETLGN
jgi:hypothetical protein